MGINDILIELASEPSSNAKINILEKHKDNEILQSVLKYTYSPFINYWVKDYAESKPEKPAPGNYTLSDALIDLDKIIGRIVTGNSARAFLEQIDSSLYNGDRKVLRKIISRDLSCGFGIESINKVWPGLVPTVPYIVKR